MLCHCFVEICFTMIMGDLTLVLLKQNGFTRNSICFSAFKALQKNSFQDCFKRNLKIQILSSVLCLVNCSDVNLATNNFQFKNIRIKDKQYILTRYNIFRSCARFLQNFSSILTSSMHRRQSNIFYFGDGDTILNFFLIFHATKSAFSMQPASC